MFVSLSDKIIYFLLTNLKIDFLYILLSHAKDVSIQWD